MSRITRTLSRDWDKIVVYVLFIAFGVYSVFYPIVSVEKVATDALEIMLGSNFVFAGSMMTYGLFSDQYKVWRIGVWVAFTGLITITGLIALVGGAKVYSYAFLFGAFAFQTFEGVRREKERKLEITIRRQLEDLLASTTSGGTR